MRFIGWRQAAYVYAVSIVFGFGFYYMLSHRHDWWGWVLLVVYVTAAEGVFLLWRRRSNANP
jgi:hypothetical protein